jgi:flagellar biosynthesis anti-sigma factor FlgM
MEINNNLSAQQLRMAELEIEAKNTASSSVANVTTNTPKPSSKLTTHDKVAISATSSQLTEISKQLQATPEFNLVRIEQAKLAIKNGTLGILAAKNSTEHLTAVNNLAAKLMESNDIPED